MIIKGSVKEVGLATLVQAMHMDRQTAVIMLWQDEREGVVFVHKGEAVHAVVADRQGSEALYELTHWDNATFRLSTQPSLPISVRTISQSDGYFAASSMKLDPVTDRILWGGTRNQITELESEADQILENDLIILLTQMESSKELFNKRRNRKPQVVWKVLTDMVNGMVFVAEDIYDEDQQSLLTVIEMASNVYPAIRMLRVQDNQLMADSLNVIYRSAASRVLRAAQADELMKGMFDVMETYCLRLGSQFNGRASADQWRSTCQVFLGELKEVLKQIRF